MRCCTPQCAPYFPEILRRQNPTKIPKKNHFIRVVETVVLENGRFVPCRKQVVLTKIGEHSDSAFYPRKQGILLLKPRKSTKLTKMAGVTPAKWPFAKSTVLTTLILGNYFRNIPRHKTHICRKKIPGELIFARIHAGPVFALARIQENIFEEVFPEYFAKFLGEFTRCEYMPRLYSHPREYRKIFLANYLCIGFVPGGNFVSEGKQCL